MRKKKKIRKNTEVSLLARVYEDLKHRKKINEKKEIKLREEQIRKNQKKKFTNRKRFRFAGKTNI